MLRQRERERERERERQKLMRVCVRVCVWCWFVLCAFLSPLSRTREQGSLLDKLDENTRVGAFDDFEEEEDEEEDDLWRDNKENTEGNAAQNAGRNADHAAGGTQHCKDEELDQLEKEVAALAAKLHEHRTKVPKLLEDRVEAEVVALRPKVRSSHLVVFVPHRSFRRC